MMKKMDYNFKRPSSLSPLGKGKGLLVPFDNLTKEQKEDHQ